MYSKPKLLITAPTAFEAVPARLSGSLSMIDTGGRRVHSKPKRGTSSLPLLSKQVQTPVRFAFHVWDE